MHGKYVPPSLDHYTAAGVQAPEAYEPYVGRRNVEKLLRLGESLAGKRWVNVNSTFDGGGVAEILRSAVPLARGLGVDADWYAIQSHDGFFSVTKKFHNLLQGMDIPISLEEIFDAYLGTIHETTGRAQTIEGDLVVVHDPQPAALIMSGILFGNVLWRCHIDTSSPSPVIWRFLLPYINHTSGAIFTSREFVGPGLHVPLYEIEPCIDPLATKNQPYDRQTAIEILGPLFHTSNIDPERPILAAISRYDVHKNQGTILRAFKRMREERPLHPPPYLIFLGNTASDDPEGSGVLKALQEEAGEDPDIRFWVNVEDNDRVVGALMHLARAFVHVSTREGFGLVVSEAMWQATPVIGSRVGGIVKQVIDGKTGHLVDPMDEAAIAARMASVLEDPKAAAAMGRRAREHVRGRFLLPELIRRYLVLLRFHSGLNRKPPEFRLNEIAYTELINHVRPRHPTLRRRGAGIRVSPSLLNGAAASGA
jgi:trehalose synthase